MIPSPSRISQYIDHRAPAAESPVVLIVDTVAGVVVVFCSHFYARSFSHSIHIFCAKDYKLSILLVLLHRMSDILILLLKPLFISTAICFYSESVQDLLYLPEHG